MTKPTYHSVNIDGLDVFYREAGNSAARTLLLLHGFPTSSAQYDATVPWVRQAPHTHTHTHKSPTLSAEGLNGSYRSPKLSRGFAPIFLHPKNGT